MKPSTSLDNQRAAVRDAATRFRTANSRVFGSVLHGNDADGSDLDLLVDPLPGTTLFDLGGLQVELEELLGVPVDLKDHEAFALASGHVPWRAMKGMRNRIAHGYFEINLDVV